MSDELIEKCAWLNNVLFMDTSGSMCTPSTTGTGTRWDDAKQFATRYFEIVGACSVCIFGKECLNYPDATLFPRLASMVPSGSTTTFWAMQQLMTYHLTKDTGKPLAAVCLTDGVPDSPQRFIEQLRSMDVGTNENEIRLHIVQLGDDQAFTDYLNTLMGFSNLYVRHSKLTDTTPEQVLNSMFNMF